MGLSIRKYATLRGVTEGAVRKAINSGRITPNDDGTIDVERADREWKENTDEAKINITDSAIISGIALLMFYELFKAPEHQKLRETNNG